MAIFHKMRFILPFCEILKKFHFQYNLSNDRACQPFLVPQCVPLRFDSFRVGRAILLSFIGSGSGGRKSGR